MYYPIVLQCTQSLKNIEAWLDQAEHHASAKQFDVGVLMTSLDVSYAIGAERRTRLLSVI